MNNFHTLYLDSYAFIENFLHEHKIKFSVNEFVGTFADLYINMLEKKTTDDMKADIEFRLIGSQPEEHKNGKKKVQLLRYGKKNKGTEASLMECKLLIECFKQLREFKRIEAIQLNINDYYNKLNKSFH